MEKKITEDLKVALKNRQAIKVSVLRMLLSEIKNKKIDEGIKTLLEDEKVLALIRKMARQHKDSIEQFEEGNRADLARKEESELLIVEEYLPEQMPEEEIKTIIKDVIEETGASSIKDMGMVMKACMVRAKGCADGKLLSKMVKDTLA